jgi:hypothetical protein
MDELLLHWHERLGDYGQAGPILAVFLLAEKGTLKVLSPTRSIFCCPKKNLWAWQRCKAPVYVVLCCPADQCRSIAPEVWSKVQNHSEKGNMSEP